MKKILLVGGAGYIGTELSKFLLSKKLEIFIFDNLIYKQKKPIFKNSKFKFIKGDLRNFNDFKILKKIKFHSIIILAGLVGDPITNKYKTLSKKINDEGLINLINFFIKIKNFEKFIFISTCSNYGFVKSKKGVKENSLLKPLSLYARSKVKIEKYLLKKRKNFSPTILRFATAFGFSDRMRFDLTINQFVLEMMYKKQIEVFDYDTWRPYCHVRDFSKLIYKSINAKKNLTDNQIYNVGSNKNNFSKRQIANLVKKHLPGKINFVEKSTDARNYVVNFDKVKDKLKFSTKYSADYGIKEIIKKLKYSPKKFNFYNKLGNFIIKKT